MMVPEKLKDGCQSLLGPIRLMVDPELDPILSELDIQSTKSTEEVSEYPMPLVDQELDPKPSESDI